MPLAEKQFLQSQGLTRIGSNAIGYRRGTEFIIVHRFRGTGTASRCSNGACELNWHPTK